MLQASKHPSAEDELFLDGRAEQVEAGPAPARTVPWLVSSPQLARAASRSPGLEVSIRQTAEPVGLTAQLKVRRPACTSLALDIPGLELGRNPFSGFDQVVTGRAVKRSRQNDQALFPNGLQPGYTRIVVQELQGCPP